MSIKMYNGLCLTTTNQLEIYQELRHIKKQVTEISQNFYYEVLAKYAVSLYLEYVTKFQNYGYEGREKILKNYNPKIYKDEMLDPWPMLSIAKEIAAANLTALHQSELTAKRYPALLDCSIEMIPTKDKILAVPISQFPKTQAIINNSPLFRRYYYWDNVEPDDSVPEQEWEERRLEWESVQDRGVEIKDLGYLVTIFDSNRDLHIGIDDIKKFAKTYMTEEMIESQKTITAACILDTNKKFQMRAEIQGRDVVKNEILGMMSDMKEPVEFFCEAALNYL